MLIKSDDKRGFLDGRRGFIGKRSFMDEERGGGGEVVEMSVDEWMGGDESAP